MIEKLRRKFIRIAALSVAGVLVLLCLTVNLLYVGSVSRDQSRLLQMITDNQGAIPDEKPMHRRGGEFTPETPFETRYFVLYLNGDGTLARSDLSHIAAVTAEDLAPFLSKAAARGEGDGFLDGYRYRVVSMDDGTKMAVFLDCHRQLRTLGAVAAITFGTTLVCTALVCAMVVLLSRRAIEPVVKSTRQQKQFITDASHELKTPITVIAASLKVLEMEVGRQKWIDKAMAQNEKLKALVEQLVTLSRLDEDRPPLQPHPFPVSDALTETAESFRDFATERGHDLLCRITPELTFCGDEYAVRQLASILLDNAARYASDGADIVFRLEKQKKGILIGTENRWDSDRQGPCDELFDRFYRADPARTGGGFGIGLSIVRSIAQAHRGAVHAVAADGILRITAVLP